MFDLKSEPLFTSAGDAAVRIRLGTHLKTREPVYWFPEDTRYPAAANLAVVGGEKTGNTQMLCSAAIQLLRQKEQTGESLGLLLITVIPREIFWN